MLDSLPVPPAAEGRRRVLITDDDSSVRFLLRTILEGEGHEVVEAEDGAEALRRAGEGRVDLLLCDIFMPDKDGLETISEFRATLGNIPIIAMSGRIDMLSTARVLGAVRVLTKPFRREAVVTLVGGVLGGRFPVDA